MNLSHSHFFKGFSPELRSVLLKTGEVKTYKPGDLIFVSGDSNTDFYVLADGRIQIHKLSKGGQKRILRTVQPGDTFATVSLFDDKPMFISAEVLGQEAKVFVIKREEFFELLKKYYELSRFIIDGLVRRIRRYGEAYTAMSVYYLDQRFISYLLDLVEVSDAYLRIHANVAKRKIEVRLPDTVKTIAEQLGTSREVLSREISKMVKKGWIEKKGQVVKIKRKKALEKRLGEE